MAQSFTCPQGHTWEDPFGGLSLTADGTVPCPVCGSATALPKESRASLLRGQSGSQGSVGPAAATIPGSEPVRDATPLTVPGYLILSELGRGGMGVVYQARHVALKRLVALKMILAGGHAGTRELARFRAEAEAVARIQHPNIVQIYEIGAHEQRPFFAMEFVPGGCLVNHVRENRLPTRAAARLVATLARAMHAVHEKGIIHRDLKPANILLAADGTPKITDFGLAKNLGDVAGQTRTGEVMGTPSYMSPEQAEGRLKDIGPASDVYALGAILYELLTARPPFKAETVMDTLLQVLYEEPVRPIRLFPNCPTDLETICLKCLHKEIHRRYPTALALAEDLERYLDGRPIEARPISRVERAWKWARRRPAAAALAVLGVLAPLVVLLLSLGYNVRLNQLNVALADTAEQKRQEAERAERERARAEKNEQDAERRRAEADRLRTLANTQRRRAEDNFRKAREAVNAMLTEVAESELANVPLMEDVRQRLLAKAVAFHSEFLEKQGTEPSLRQQTGQAYVQLGDIYRLLGRYDQAAAAFKEGVARFDQLTRDFPNEPEYQRDLALAQFHTAELARTRGQLAEASKGYNTAQALQARLSAEFPNNPDYRFDLAHTLNDLALVNRLLGQPAAAGQLYKQAIHEQETLVKEHPNNRPEFREDLAGSYNDLGALYRSTKEPGEAEKAYRTALGRYEELVKQYPGVAAYKRKLAAVSNNLGNLLADQHGPAAGEPVLRTALGYRKELLRDFPSVLAYRQELANTHQNLAALLAAAKKLPEAEKECNLGLDLQRKLVADFPNVADFQGALAGMLDNLAAVALSQNRPEQALTASTEAQGIHRQLRLNPAERTDYRQLLRKHHVTRADALLRLAEKDPAKHADAAKSAQALTALAPESAEDLRLAGIILTRCSTLPARDPRLADADRKQLAETYARQAVEALDRAVQLGWANAVELRTAAVWQPLRSRPDFQKLLGELDRKGMK